MKYFASDNNSGAHPQMIEVLASVNSGKVSSYGNDVWTDEAREHFVATFGKGTRAFFVFTGTASNVMGLKSLLRSHECIICPQTSHLHTDECGSIEAVGGNKLILAPAHDGKIALEALPPLLAMREDVHHPYPKALSIAQLTECLTMYTIDELRALGRFCKEHDLFFHMDGARLANAAANAGTSLKAMTTDVGVDMLSFGGTKNGLLLGEAVVFLNPDLGEQFAYVQKQHMQLGSKMRFVAAQFTHYLRDDFWRVNARHANNMATLLSQELADLPFLKIMYRVEGNCIFARMPHALITTLNKDYYFYIIDANDAPGFPVNWPLVRLMTSFNTTEEEVRELALAIREQGIRMTAA